MELTEPGGLPPRTRKRPAKLNPEIFDFSTKNQRTASTVKDGNAKDAKQTETKEKQVSLNTLRQKQKPGAIKRSNEKLEKLSRDYIEEREKSAYFKTITTPPLCKLPVAKAASETNVQTISPNLSSNMQKEVTIEEPELRDLSPETSNASSQCSVNSSKQRICTDVDFTNGIEPDLNSTPLSLNNSSAGSSSQSFESAPIGAINNESTHPDLEEQGRLMENKLPTAANKSSCSGYPGGQNSLDNCEWVDVSDSEKKNTFTILHKYKTIACKSLTFKSVVKNLGIALLTPEIVKQDISAENMDKYAFDVNSLVKIMLFRLERNRIDPVLRILREGESMPLALKGLNPESKEALEIKKSGECKTAGERRLFHYSKLKTHRVVQQILNNAFRHFRSECKPKKEESRRKTAKK